MTPLNRLLFKLLSADSSHIDGQKDGQEELLSQESWSRGNTRLYFDHLLRQDGHTNAEPHDRGSRLVWRRYSTDGYQWIPKQ
jgi:hypothetical protein